MRGAFTMKRPETAKKSSSNVQVPGFKSYLEHFCPDLTLYLKHSYSLLTPYQPPIYSLYSPYLQPSGLNFCYNVSLFIQRNSRLAAFNTGARKPPFWFRRILPGSSQKGYRCCGAF